MGLSPTETLGLSLHDYGAAINQFNAHHAADDDEPLSADDFDDMLFGIDAKGLH